MQAAAQSQHSAIDEIIITEHAVPPLIGLKQRVEGLSHVLGF